MNIELHRVGGTNSNEYVAQCEFLPPGMTDWRLNACWQAYEASGDGLFTRFEFERLVREAHIICVVICGPYTKDFAIFGLELMSDLKGPYTSFLFFEQQAGRLADIAGLVVWACYSVAKAHDGNRSEFGRMFLKGRKGWPRMLKRMGLEIDDKGFIDENQKAFGYGTERRQ